MSLRTPLIPSLVLVLALALAPVAAAGTMEDPEMVDGSGDAGPNGAATPAGSEWADLAAAWLEEETLDSITFKIALASTPPAMPPSEYVVGVQFTTHDMAFLVGWSVFGGSGSGFVCEADADGNPTMCTLTPGASYSSGSFTIPVARDAIHAGNASSVISAPFAFAGMVASTPPQSPVQMGEFIAFDESPPGRDYVFALGKQAANASVGDVAIPPVDPAPIAQAVTEAQDPAEPAKESPGVETGLAVALAAAAAVGLALARRRSK